MADTQKIYDDFFEIDSEDNLGFIKFYESNNLLLENKSHFKDKEEFDVYLMILAKYIIGLEKTGKYSKTIKFADKTIQLIDSKINEFDINLKDFTLYWSVLTSKGRAHYYLKEYNNSLMVFKRLHTWEPDNDQLRNWYEASRSCKRNSINKYLYITAGILVLIAIFWGRQFNDPMIRQYLLSIGILLCFIGIFNEYLIDNIYKLFNRK